MKLRKKKYLIVLILVLVLFISIGFAYLTSNLSIGGLAILKKSTFDVHFENLVDDNEGTELNAPAKISADGKQVDFEVTLDSPNDIYYFYVDVVNKSTMDVMLGNWSIKGIDDDIKQYIDANVTYADGISLTQYDLLKESEKECLKVEVKYKNIESSENLPTKDTDFTLTLDTTYTQADERARTREKIEDNDSPIVKVKKSESSTKGNNRWYKNLTLNTKLIDPSGISSAKYCTTTSDSCTPDNPVELVNNSFNIRLENSNTPWTICVETVDNEENKDTYCEKNKYYVDGEDPTISSITVTPNDSSLSITLESNDNYSGVARYYYSKDGGAHYISSDETNYTFSSLDSKDYIVMAYVEDVAGNKSTTVTKTAYVGKYNWCRENGISKLGECAIATETHNTDITAAKQEIEAKQQPDFSKTSPTYTYKEKYSSTLSTISTNNSTFAFATSYDFNKETGQYTLVSSTVSDIKTLNLEDENIYYSCLSNLETACNTLYKLDSYKQENGSYKISKYDYTSDVDTYDINGIGMYEAEDDLGKSYYYRGSVGGNFVKFAGMYWRILRINGDGSIRLMYFSDTDTKKGKNAGNSQINLNYWDPTYVGFMYNDEDFSESDTISMETNFSNFNENTTYYFGKNYTWDESAKRYKLNGTVESGDITSGVWKDIHDEIMSGKYIYSCFGKTETATCSVLMKITGYDSVKNAKVQYISHSSTSYANATQNNSKSSILTSLETWYKSNIENQSDGEGNLYSDYLENSIFCNDRNLSQNTTGDGFSFNTITHYGAYYRLADNKTPSYQCPDVNRDRFTLKGSSSGNELLDYPIGIITADEVAYAGGVNGQPNSLYFINYNDNSSLWTMSPAYFHSPSWSAYVWDVNPAGSLSPTWIARSYGIRPVVSLKANTIISGGDGTADKPYTVTLAE